MGRLWNNRGSAMLASMIASMLVVGAASVAYRNYNVNHDSVRVARIRNLMNLVEAQVRRRALQPEAYVDCNSTGGAGSCRINTNFYNDLNLQNVAGAKSCTNCGVRVMINPGNVQMNSSRMFRAQIVYQGSEAKLKPIDIEIQVPKEVLQADQFHCGTQASGMTPLFAGFDANGAPICQGFAGNPCAPGYFLKYVNVSARSVQCEPLPPPVACDPERKFVSFDWVGGSIQYSCNDLVPPPFTAQRSTRIPATVPPPSGARPNIGFESNVIPVTVTTVQTATETYTYIPSPSPVPTPTPPPTPVCRSVEVQLGMGNGATPKVFGYMACQVSCQGTFGADTRCGGPCAQGARDWMYCYDCRRDSVVCN